MSKFVDERVVEMQFDNQKFEQNAQRTLSTLDKLKQSLNLSGASKGLEDVGRAAQGINLSGLSGAAETVQAKFSALGVMGVTALANITNSAVNAGKRIVSALTIDPIKTGFSEYETQINAVQTILANTSSKGTTIDDVNKALDTLNAYADKTIYNFTEMTRNIGTFTAAGVELDTATSAIQGIANLAAVSGSTSQQASTAMYQLSQALASGTVKLQDWNSVVNAGMGGQVFQDALKRTAKVMGKNVDALIKKNGSFRESLKDGWVTTEVLTETLNQFTMCAEEGTKEWNEYKKSLKEKGYTEEQAEEILKMGKTATEAATKVKTFTQLWDTLKEAAQSGWTQSWEIIVGNFEEAKTLLTEVSDTIGSMIGDSANARNEMLQGWKDLGGRTALIDSVRNAFRGVMGVVTPIKEALNDIFPPITSKQLFNLTEGLKKFTEKLKISETTATNIKRTFKGVFAIFDVGVTAVKAIAKGFFDLVGVIAPAGNGILAFTANIGDGLVKFSEFIKSSDVFNKSIQFIVKSVTFLTSKFSSFISFIKEKFQVPGMEVFRAILDRISVRMEQVKNTAVAMKDGVVSAAKAMGSAFKEVGILDMLVGVWEVVKKISGGLIDALGKAFGGLASKLSNINFDGILDLINGLSLSGIAAAMLKFTKGSKEAGGAFGGFGDILDNVVEILGGVKDTLEAYQTQLKAGTLIKIASAIGILAASIFVISLIDSNKLTSSLAAIGGLFGELIAAMTIFGKISGPSKDAIKSCGVMISMSVSVAILATAMKKIGELDLNGVIKGLTGVAGLVGIVIAAAKLMRGQDSTITKFSGQMILMSVAVGALSRVAKYLSTFSWEELGKAGAGLTGIITVLVAAAKIMDSESRAITKFGGQMILMSAAVGALAGVAKLLSTFSWEELGKAGAGLAGIISMLVMAAKIMNSETSAITKFGGQMVVMSIAVGALTGVAKVLSAFSWEELGKAGAGLFGMITMLTAAAKIMNGDSASITKFGGQMVVMSVAIGALTVVAKQLSAFSWEELGKAGVGLLGIIAMLVAASKLMAVGGAGSVLGAGQMLIMSAAIAVFAGSMKLIAGIKVGSIIKGLLSLIATFAILGVTGLVLAPIAPILVVLAGSVALLGAAMAGVGIGVMAFAAGLGALATVGAAGATAIVGALTIIVTGIAGLIPALVHTLDEALVALCGLIIHGAPAIAMAISAVLVAILATITATIPPLLKCIEVLLTALLNFLVSFTPKLVDAGMKLLLGLLQGIADNIEQIVVVAVDIVTSFIDGIASKLPDVVDSGLNLMISFINSMADGIRNNVDATLDAIDNLMDSLIYAVVAWFKHSRENGKELINKMIEGLKSKFKEAKNAAKDIISDMIAGVKEKFESFKQAGKDLISGFIQGVKNKASSVVEAAKGVVSDALQAAKNLLGIHSPSTEFAEVGEYSDLGIIVGLKRFAGKVADTAKEVGSGALEAMKDSISGAAGVFGSDLDTTPTIRPVLDLSDVKSGARNIGTMLSTRRTLSINTNNVGSVASSMNRLQNMRESNEFVSAINGLRKDLSDMPRNTYIIDGVTYDDGSNIANAVQTLVRHTMVGRRA